MANNVIQDNKCFKDLETAAASFLAAFNLSVDPSDTLSEVFDTLSNGISMYTVAGNDTTVYPVAVPTGDGPGGIVLAIKEGRVACFVFIYNGEVYICDVFTIPVSPGIAVSNWYKVTTTAV